MIGKVITPIEPPNDHIYASIDETIAPVEDTRQPVDDTRQLVEELRSLEEGLEGAEMLSSTTPFGESRILGNLRPHRSNCHFAQRTLSLRAPAIASTTVLL
jgi:hypothetical protein